MWGSSLNQQCHVITGLCSDTRFCILLTRCSTEMAVNKDVVFSEATIGGVGLTLRSALKGHSQRKLEAPEPGSVLPAALLLQPTLLTRKLQMLLAGRVTDPEKPHSSAHPESIHPGPIHPGWVVPTYTCCFSAICTESSLPHKLLLGRLAVRDAFLKCTQPSR